MPLRPFLARFIIGILLAGLLFGCAMPPRNVEDASTREVSDTRVATVRELGDQEVTIRSGPRSSR